MKILSNHGTLLGEEATSAIEVILVESPSISLVEIYAKENFPPTRCHHAHDCCGRWYQSGEAKVHTVDEDYGIYAITRYEYRNV